MRCVSLVHADVELVHACEAHTKRALRVLDDPISDDDVVPLLNAAAKAQRVARQRLSECGFDGQVAKLKSRAQKRRLETAAFTAKAAARSEKRAAKKSREQGAP